MSMTVCQQGVNSGFGPWLGKPRVLGFEFSISSRRPLMPPPAEDLNMNFLCKQQEFGNDCLQNLITQQNKSEPEFNHELNQKNSAKNEGTGGGGWSFLQALSDATQGEKKGENEEVYVHPLAKQSASMLSEKSLEMCTESLGSETGSDMSENGDDLMSSLVGSETERSPRMPCFGVRKRFSRVDSFPPPLTTISGGSRGGGGGFHVMSQREEGRLVIKAVSVGTHESCFKAERRDGRLRLHFMESFDHEYEINDEFEDGGCEEEEEDFDHDHENDEDEVELLGNLGRSMGCKEEGGGRNNKERVNWEPIWVATS